MKKKLIFCFDLDNVICLTKKNYYHKSRPIHQSINIINKLHECGFIIKIFTARFMGRSNEDIKVAKKRGYKFTERQLKKWGIKYHKLIFGKPSFDIIIDDKALFFNKCWHAFIEKKFLEKKN
jgi:hypothetical protein